MSVIECERNRLFAKGLGFGLGHSFKYLDEILQEELLRQLAIGEEFAGSLGEGLGNNFPSLNIRLQQKILTIAKDNSFFFRGLKNGLSSTYKYLDHDTKHEILKLNLHIPDEVTNSNNM